MVDRERGTVDIYEELPRDFVHEDLLRNHPDYYTINFEWGTWEGDVFAIQRHPRSDMSTTNIFLHPIVRHYAAGAQLSEHHILEDLFGSFGVEGDSGMVLRRSQRSMQEYHEQEHVAPLRNYFAVEMGATVG